MGKDTGFLEFGRSQPPIRPPEERVHDFDEHFERFGEQAPIQASRCMDCGVPFCNSGCPLGNRIPEFNDAVYRGAYEEAYQVLRTTNNFPEFTGRICPAPCEASCVLGIHGDAVTIEHIEKEIADVAWERGWVTPKLPVSRTGKSVAVVGSGPAGLAAADELNQLGHRVKVFERDSRPGGLLTYGIPDYKLNKEVVSKRIQVLQEEGVVFQCNTNIGHDLQLEELQESFDAVLLALGSKTPRDISAPGRGVDGVHFAMDFLTQNNQKVSHEPLSAPQISAKDKTVLVIGGGDTGSDCIGTAIRQGARSVIQATIGEQPPLNRAADNPWPMWPNTLKTSSSHEEGCERLWGLSIAEVHADPHGRVTRVTMDHVAEGQVDGAWTYTPTGKQTTVDCDLVLLAIGFAHPEHEGLVHRSGLSLDPRGNLQTSGFQTSTPGVFAAGDSRRGQSLVVWAIAEGRRVATAIHKWLEEESPMKR